MNALRASTQTLHPDPLTRLNTTLVFRLNTLQPDPKPEHPTAGVYTPNPESYTLHPTAHNLHPKP